MQLKRTNLSYLLYLCSPLWQCTNNITLHLLDNSCLKPGCSIFGIKYILGNVMLKDFFVCTLSAKFSDLQSNCFPFCASNRYLCFAYYTLSIKLRKITRISGKRFWRSNSYRNSFLIHLELRLRRCTDTLIYCAIRL